MPLPDESTFVAAHRENVPPPTVHTTATIGGRVTARGGRGRKGGRGRGKDSQELATSNPGRGWARSGGRGGVRSRRRGGRVPNECTDVNQIHEVHSSLNQVPVNHTNLKEITITKTAREASQSY